ncbi:hypothetical protein IAU60_004024 [Kwoniella sp. DSM 27419]
MAQPEEIEQDLSHIHWSWPEAIAANPARSLANGDLAMDYFAYSPFWDTKSNNNVLRTQRRVENPTYGHAEEKIELNAFTSGFEYVVSHAQIPDLFVIQKREVGPSGKRDQVTGSWFILHDKIYQSPTMYDVVSNRLRNAAYLISKTLGSLSENRPPANPRSTTVWRSIPPSSSETQAQSGVASPHAVPEEAGEVPVAKAAGKKDEANKSRAEFDWNLFHALQSTRSALPTLDKSARSPGPRSDPLTELRAVEASMAAQFAFQQPSGQAQPSAAGRLGSKGSTSIGIKAPGHTPGTMSMAGMSPAALSFSGAAKTPALAPNSLEASSPRIPGLSPMSATTLHPQPGRAVSAATASPAGARA